MKPDEVFRKIPQLGDLELGGLDGLLLSLELLLVHLLQGLEVRLGGGDGGLEGGEGREGLDRTHGSILIPF